MIDRRGASGRGPSTALIGLLPLLLRSRFGIVGVIVVGGFLLLQGSGLLSGPAPERAAGERPATQAQAAEQELVELTSFVLDDAQQSFRRAFAADGKSYRAAKLVLFTDTTQSGCGYGSAATGPFYCPADERVYIDLGFFRELDQRFGAPGDFAQAYVIAHEIGHHVQHQLGYSDRVRRASRAERDGAGGLSVRLELQADCLAGIWAHGTGRRDLLEQGDIEEGLAAAAAIGDDRLQRQAQGTVNPETWSHGSSEQRSRWFRRGYEQGQLTACDTFGSNRL